MRFAARNTALVASALFGALVTLAACASDSTEDPIFPDGDASSPPPKVDAAESDGPCASCESFPETCVAGAFCPTPLPFAPRQLLLAAAGRSASDIWVAGSLGTVLHYDGRQWLAEPMPIKETFGAILLRGPEETWLGSTLRSSYARAPDLRGDGGAPGWVNVGAVDGSVMIRDLWSKEESSWIWAGFDETSGIPLVRFRRNGTTLEVQSPANVRAGGAINGIDGLSASEVWAVGDRGLAYRITAADSDTPILEQRNTLTNQSLEDVSVTPSGEASAVGTVGTVRRYRVAELGWERVEVPTTARLRGAFAASSDNVWIVGDEATVLHFDGARWSRSPIAGLEGERPSLRAVMALPDGHVLVVGERVVLELRTKGG